MKILERQPSNNNSVGDEYALAQNVSIGDKNARRTLANLVLNRVRALTHYLAGGDPEADDYAQLAIMEILNSAGTFRGESSIKSWADQITVRTVMRHIKKKKRRDQFIVLHPNPEIDGTASVSTEEQLLKQQVSERIANLLGELSPKYRVAVIMKLILGYTIKEIATATKANPHTVDYRLRRGREHIRRKMLRDTMLKEWIIGK